MNKKPLAILLMLILSFSLSCNVFAATNTSDSSKLKQVQDTKKDLQSKIEALDNEITDVLKKIDANKKDINSLSVKIKNNESQLNNAQNNLKVQNSLMNKRLRALYMCNGAGYLEVIINSSNFSDFLSRMDTISKVMNYDKNLINNIEDQRQAQAKQKETLTNENARLETLKAENSKTLTNLSADIKAQNDLLSKATDQEKSIIADIRAKELAEQKAKELAKAQAAAAAAAVAVKNNTSLLAAPVVGAPKAGSYSTVLTLDSTAYSGSGCASNGSQVTRNPSGYSTIAVDPRVIPINSKVYVSGYGYAIAADTGAAIQGKIIDVYFSSEIEALAWGRQTVQVYILN